MGIGAEYDDRRQGFSAKTSKPIKMGQELLFFYGDDCFEDAVNNYGFAPESAPLCKKAGL